MSLVDRTIAAYRASYDLVATRARSMSDDDLARPSGASEWTVAQVLSHLGSAAEIGLIVLRAAPAADERPSDANQAIWDRWNALSPREQAEGFLRETEQLVSACEALDPDQRHNLRSPVSYLPDPADLTLMAGLRLNEAALHGWDVEVAFDDAAAIPADVAAVLLEQLQGPIAFMLGFTGKPGALGGREAAVAVETTTSPTADFGLLIGDQAALAHTPQHATATLRLPAESFIRLLAGRLTPRHTPDDVAMTGDVTLEDLRAVFPGY
ncbi:MAG: hypothetical protein QOE64_1358 [Frankiales bacterium]|nr:hypothetical protein [Frankiales bacterium]